MKKLDCEEQSVAVKLPPCAGVLASVTATLTREGHTAVPLVLTERPNEQITVAIQDPLPANVPFPKRGIWRLNIQTPCGCYEAPVYVDCPAPAFVATHTPTPVNDASTECCIPDDALTFTVTGLSPPTIEAEGYPDAALLVDDSTAYAVRLGVVAPTLSYRWVNESGVVLATGTFGALGTTEYHDIDITCATYALLPPEED